MRYVLCILFAIFPLLAQAQQAADVNSWFKEYESRFNQVIERRTKQKSTFAEDVQFSKPDYIVFIPKVEPEKMGDTYNDHFQVFDKPDGTLFAIWCQATCEGALDQHVAFTRSCDKGKTWDAPKVLAGNRTVAEGMANGGQIASWASPMVSRSGRVYVLYNQFIPGRVSTNRQHTGVMMGIYSDDDGDTWSLPVEIPIPRTSNDSDDPAIPPEWVIWQRPLRQGKNGAYLVGVSRHVAPKMHAHYRSVTQFIHFDNIDDNPEIKDLTVRWVLDEKVLHRGVYCEEPSIVILPNGSLFCVMRTGIGSPCWTMSSDSGETWSEPEPLRMKDDGEIIAHPMSPCPIYDWKGNEAGSGTYFFLAHNKYDQQNANPWQNRGPLFLYMGQYRKDAKQPVWFDDSPRCFIDREGGNSFYTSTTIVDGKTVLWYPDQKFYLLGRIIGEEFLTQFP